MFSSNASQVSDSATYIEDIFSCFLYTGNSSTQTITNGIDLAGEGGLVWTKCRDQAYNHWLFDTNRGVNKVIHTNTTAAQATKTVVSLTAFNSSGYTVVDNGSGADGGSLNYGNFKYASWTFRKQEKFFDVVTYTGTGLDRTIAHNLGSVPGCVIVKCTSSGGSATYNWVVWHRSLASNEYLQLNTTDQKFSGASVFNTTSVPNTSTTFSVGTNAITNQSGQTYVAYLFAHNAGGFGLTGTDNVISCGSYTTDASGNGTFQTLGYEPQWVMVKNITSAEDWVINDNMRGMRASPAGSAQALFPNTSGAEVDYGLGVNLGATGFTGFGSGSKTYIYIAIRRGPMKTPTSGTSVFVPVARTGTGTAVTVTGFQGPLDSLFVANRTDSTDKFLIANRLTAERYTLTSSTAAETVSVTAAFPVGVFGVMNGFNLPATTSNVTNKSATTYINYGFTRAPGFMDVCCYTGTGTNRTVAHNLTVVPELMIVKERNTAGGWKVYSAPTGAGQYLFLNSDAAPVADASFYTWNNTAPTSSVFSLGIAGDVNQSGATYVAYLFASCPGVSKIGTFTYPGTSTVDCGFSSGARFVMLKRTSTTGGWLVFDTARGIVSGNDPYLELQSTNAEVTTGDVIDPNSSGFAIGSNLSNGTYIFLAIA